MDGVSADHRPPSAGLAQVGLSPDRRGAEGAGTQDRPGRGGLALPAGIETAWLPVALSRRVGAKPVAVKIAGVPLVLWRSAEGVHAFRDRCPHRNYPLSEGHIKNGRLTCPYHGWAFSGDGACAEVPGCPASELKRLTAETVGIAEFDGVVFVCLKPEEPFSACLPEMPEGLAHDHFWWAMKPQRARVFDALDNVLDPFHTNFIHNGYIRVAGKRQRVTQTIHTFEKSFEAVYVQDTDYGWMSRALEGPRKASRGRYLPPVAF